MQASFQNNRVAGWWTQDDKLPEQGYQATRSAIIHVTDPVFILNMNGHLGVSRNGIVTIANQIEPKSDGYPLCAYASPLHPENLGDPLFKKTHNLRYAYIMGAMAGGITSVEMVKEAGRTGMIGFYGAAGLSLAEIEAAITNLQKDMGNIPFGFNLIHSPNDPEHEASVVSLYLNRGIRLISASAYIGLTLPLVYYRVKGIYRDDSGDIIVPNKVIAKVSRVEVAGKFFSPPPEKLLKQLVDQKMIRMEEADLAQSIPVADALTAEADSGGHTDNRPALSLLPTMLALRDKLSNKYKYQYPLYVGLGGGIATPESTLAAFSMGAAYVLTGSINQACIEAGTSEAVRHMLAETGQADITMAPSADMFELGIKVQVLKRGTMYPVRASKLYDLYNKHNCLENIPVKERLNLEKNFFRCSISEEWDQTKNFFLKSAPKQLVLAETNPKHKMALIFRSYLGRSSRWATSGEPSRKLDYQIWCGPSMGAFNEWVKGSFLEKPENRRVATVAMNLLFGACVASRANMLRSQGITLPVGIDKFSPMELSKIYKLLKEGNNKNYL